MSGYSSDEDEDLKRAIALSLAGMEDSTPQEPIDLTGDDEDEGLKNEIEEQSVSQHNPTATELKVPENLERDRDPSKIIERTQFGIPGIDRKKMEEERLTRMSNKRKASISPPPRVTKAPKTTRNPASNIMSYTQQQAAIQATGAQYLKGVVKKTWAYGCPRSDDDIKIEVCYFL